MIWLKPWTTSQIQNLIYALNLQFQRVRKLKRKAQVKSCIQKRPKLFHRLHQTQEQQSFENVQGEPVNISIGSSYGFTCNIIV